MTKTVFRVSIMADLNAVLESTGGYAAAKISFVCRDCFIQMGVNEQKVLMVDGAFRCVGDAFRSAKQREPTLTKTEFEKRLVPLKGKGLHNVHLYEASSAN